MTEIIDFFEKTGWLANLFGIATVISAIYLFIHRKVLGIFASKDFNKIIPRNFDRVWDEALIKKVARVAIVDDQPADFPQADLKGDGYQIQVFKQVTLATTAQIAIFDVVFLDMKGIVKDDVETGGLKLIADLRRINPAQKICAVSSKTFDINATDFFRQADDAKKKPLTAQECRTVLNTFFAELFDPSVLKTTASEANTRIPKKIRVEAIAQIKKFVAKEISIDQLRDFMRRNVNDHDLAYRIVNIARAVEHAS